LWIGLGSGKRWHSMYLFSAMRLIRMREQGCMTNEEKRTSS